MFGRIDTPEEGFTLIELLIAIVVSGIILSALATGFITTMAGSQNIHDRFVESHDAQLLATVFPSDVQSADPLMINPDLTDACGSPSSGIPVIRFQWQENNDTRLTVFSAAYRRVSRDLVRDYYSCTGLSTEPLATILTRPVHTSMVVAHDLSEVTPPSPAIDKAHGKVGLTLYSHQTEGERKASIPEYSYTFTAAMRTRGISAPFVVTVAPGTKRAGEAFPLTITAKLPTGATDPSYQGEKTILFEGALDSPTGVHPTFPMSVNFTAGEATPPPMVTLVRVGTTQLTLSQGSHVGSSPLITVIAGSPAGGTLVFTTCPPDRVQGQSTTSLSITRTTRDASGNALPPGGLMTVALTQTGGAAIAPTAVTIASGASESPTFSSTNPGTIGTPIVLTGASNPYVEAKCEFTTTGTPGFSVTIPAGDRTAGDEFEVTITKTDDGANPDPDYNAAISVDFSGPQAAPDGAHPPLYPPAVLFSGGIGKARITLFKAFDSTVLTAANVGVAAGSSPAFKVKARAGSALCIIGVPVCTGYTSVVAKSAQFTGKVGLVDQYHNPAKAVSPITVTVAKGTYGSGPTYSSSPMVIPSGGTVTPGTFTATADGGAKKVATFTANSTPVFTSATINLETP